MEFQRSHRPHAEKVVTMRIILHYLIAVVILTIYGGQV
jgi:hypothetical protein